VPELDVPRPTTGRQTPNIEACVQSGDSLLSNCDGHSGTGTNVSPKYRISQPIFPLEMLEKEKVMMNVF
jgi:hypothetical protein